MWQQWQAALLSDPPVVNALRQYEFVMGDNSKVLTSQGLAVQCSISHSQILDRSVDELTLLGYAS